MKVYITACVSVPHRGLLEQTVFSTEEKANEYREEIYKEILDEFPEASPFSDYGIKIPNKPIASVFISEYDVL